MRKQSELISNHSYFNTLIHRIMDRLPCSNQLYPAGAVNMPLNKPYTANLIDLNDLKRLWPQRSLQEGFTSGNSNNCMKLVSMLILVQLVLLLLIKMKILN